MDKKAAQKVLRQRRAQDNQKMREGMRTGDERYLPARDKGPVRAFVRDYVDTRISFMEYLLPVLVLIMALQFAGLPQLSGPIWSATILLLVLEVALAALAAQQGDPGPVPRGERLKGWRFYALMRAIQLRPLRMPKPRSGSAPAPAQALLTLRPAVEPHRAVDLALALEQGDRGRALVGEVGPELADPRLGLGAGRELWRPSAGSTVEPSSASSRHHHGLSEDGGILGLLDVGLHERRPDTTNTSGRPRTSTSTSAPSSTWWVEQRERDALAQRR